MKTGFLFRCLLVVVFLILLPLACAQEPQAVRIPLRDGVKLAADLYLPEGPGPFPTLVQMTPYRRRPSESSRFFASHCYAVLKVSVRGRFGSEGSFKPDAKGAESQDGYDIIEWAAQQPWSNSRVGTYGISTPGTLQLVTALTRPPHLQAMFVSYSAEPRPSWVDHGVYLNIFPAWWASTDRLARRLSTREDWQAWLTDWRDNELPMLVSLLRPEFINAFFIDLYSDYWTAADHAEINVPIYHEGGWYDRYIRPTLRNFSGIRSHARSEAARKGQSLIMGPWSHGGGVPATETVAFSPEARIDRLALHLRWFDYWLKGIETGISEEPPVRLYVMGADQWLDAESWPLPETRYIRYYLRAGPGPASGSLNDGRLTRAAPEPNEKADEYVHDPYDPVPTIGGHGGGASRGWVPGPRDQRPAEARSLTFTSNPLEEDLLVVGEVRVRFFASSSAVDTDFVLTLTDVYPNGYSATLRQNAVRAMHRLGGDREAPIEPGKVYEFNLTLDAIANLFKAGHHIRLNISSSSFPRFLPNPGTGQPPPRVTQGITAHNVIYHDSQYPSAIELPVLNPKSASYRPSIELTSPANDYFASGESVLLAAQASAYGGSNVHRVEFLVDGSPIRSDTDAPYSFNWTGAKDGRHVITAKVHDSKGRTKESFPVTIFVGKRALERSVMHSADDAEEGAEGSMYLTSSDLELIHQSQGGDQVIGLHFADIRIPKGAKIKKAYLQFTVDEPSSEKTDLIIQAELGVNPQGFRAFKQNISSRQKTVASVKWSPEAWKLVGERSEKQRTPDLAALIQEVIVQPGWQEGNALVFIISGSGQRVAESYDGDARGAPRLYIEF